MGILRSEIIFLIFGILGLYTVNGQISDRDKMLEQAKRIAEATNIVEQGKFEQELERYIELARKNCNENGGPKAFDVAEKGLEKFGNCVTQTLTPEQGFDPSTGGLDGNINYFCPKVQPVQNCVEQFLNSITLCLDDNTLKAVHVMKRFVLSLLNYACENNGEHIKTFIKDDGLNCSITQQVPLTNCLGLLGRKEPEAGQSNTETSKLHSFGPNSDDCESFKEFESCVDDKLKRCNKPSITEIGNHVVHSLYEEAGCVEILSSAASPTTVINSLMVIIGIAMLL